MGKLKLAELIRREYGKTWYGYTYLQPNLALSLWDFRLQPIATQFAKISFREYEILNLIAKHKSYDEISDRLHISLKLSIESRDQLLEILNHAAHYKNSPKN